MHLSVHVCTAAYVHFLCTRAIWRRGVEATGVEVATDGGLTSHFMSLNRLNSSPRFLPFPGLPGAQCALVSVIKIDGLK